MAFVRWRGRCAQLLATVYDGGRSKQITLACLPGFYVPESTKRYVAEEFPGVKVDWEAVNRSLAEGPPGLLKQKVPARQLDMALVEQYLREWAAEAEEAVDASRLYAAAEVLTRWRTVFYRKNELPLSSKVGKPAAEANLEERL